MKMRDLERASGVGRETIRYYIREGLLPEPERHARNAATYGPAHAERLKAIKRLQEERFLPLEVIKRLLDGDPDALPANYGSFPELDALLAGRLGIETSAALTPLETLTQGDPVIAADAHTLDRLAVIRIRRTRKGAALDLLDARILTLWRDLRRAGYGPEAFSAAQVRLYADAVEALAPVEVANFYAGFEGRVNQAEAAALAQTGVELVNGLLAALRIRAVLAEVARRTPPSAPAAGE